MSTYTVSTNIEKIEENTRDCKDSLVLMSSDIADLVINTSPTNSIVKNYEMAVQMGEITDCLIITAVGRRSISSGSGYVTVYQGVIDPYPFPTSDQTLKISSTSVNDITGGTGARTVVVEGYKLDGTFNSETLNMNGQTGVTLANQYYRISKAEVTSVGSNETNIGDIYVGYGTITGGVNNLPLRRLVAGYAQQFFSGVFIPAGYYGLIRNIEFKGNYNNSNNYGKNIGFRIMQRTMYGVKKIIFEVESNEWLKMSDLFYRKITGASDLWIEAKPLLADDVDVFTVFTIYLEKI